jgi:GTP-dependent phosphoenolpyruvate carboxykinase
MIEEFYNKFGDKIPKDLRDCLKELKEKLGM